MLSSMNMLQSLRTRRLAGGILVLAVTQFGASLAGLLREYVLNGVF